MASHMLPDHSTGVRRVTGPVLVVCSDRGRGGDYVAGLRSLGLLAVEADATDAACELNGLVDFSAVLVDIGRTSDWWVLLRLAALHGPWPLVPLARPAADGRRYRQFASSVGCSAFVAKPTTPERLRDTVMRLRRGGARAEKPPAHIH